MTINMENYQFSSETAEDRDISSNKRQVLTLEKIKLNADQRITIPVLVLDFMKK